MKKHFLLIGILAALMCLVFSVSIPIAGACEPGQAVVIRKKITLPPAPEKVARAENPPRPFYDPAGKIDPFEPLFMETAKKRTENRLEYAESIHGAITDLQKIDLSQLALTAIIRAASGNRALVREASGRGYIIVNNMRIGRHRGRVVAILKDRVVVEEKMKDVYGEIHFQKTQLRLPSAR